jgi:hypothetical protein
MGEGKLPSSEGHREGDYKGAEAGVCTSRGVFVGLEEASCGHDVEFVQLSTDRGSLRDEQEADLQGPATARG